MRRRDTQCTSSWCGGTVTCTADAKAARSRTATACLIIVLCEQLSRVRSQRRARDGRQVSTRRSALNVAGPVTSMRLLQRSLYACRGSGPPVCQICASVGFPTENCWFVRASSHSVSVEHLTLCDASVAYRLFRKVLHPHPKPSHTDSQRGIRWQTGAPVAAIPSAIVCTTQVCTCALLLLLLRVI